jgi:hypothetical protein
MPSPAGASPAFGPLELALDLGPGEDAGVGPGGVLACRPGERDPGDGPQHRQRGHLGHHAGQLLIAHGGQADGGMGVGEDGIQRMMGEDVDDRREAGDDGLHEQVGGQADGVGRLAPGMCRSTGPHSTRPPKRRTTSTTPRTTPDEAWAATAGVRRVPTAMTVNTTTATTGRVRTSRARSTGAGRVRAAMRGAGRARQQQGSGGQDQQEALDEQGGERPVGGQVGHRPGEGQHQGQTGPRPGTTTVGGSAPSPGASGPPGGRPRRSEAHGGDGQPGHEMEMEGVGAGHRGRLHPRAKGGAAYAGPMVDRLERLTDLVLVLLRDDRPKPLREIAAEVPGYPAEGEARRQAFERDKRTLRDGGVEVSAVPIEGREQVGYVIRPEDFYLPDLDLAPDEQAALNLAVAGVHLGDPSGRDALWRLGLPASAGVQPFADLTALPALPVLYDAVRRRAAVTFDYRGDPVTWPPPCCVSAAAGGTWSASTWTKRRRGRSGSTGWTASPRWASPARPSCPTTSTRPPRSPRSRGGWERRRPSGVDVLVDAGLAPLVVAEVGGADRVHERRPDGAVVVRLEVTNVAALRSWVLELGEHAEVLGSRRASAPTWSRGSRPPPPAPTRWAD